MATLTIRLTDRDVAILKFINTFGFCEIKHIQKEFTLKKSLSYGVMQRLIQANLVQHQQVYHLRHGVYLVTKQGAAYTELAALPCLPRHYYDHHLTVIDVYQALKKRDEQIFWVSERQLIQEKKLGRSHRKSHLADGMIIHDEKKIAIEVELTVKSKRWLETILRGYVAEMDITEVWYFCQPNTYKLLQPFLEKMSYVKTFKLSEFFHAALPI